MIKPVRLRRLAADDVETAVDHLLDRATADVAVRFVDAVERAVAQVGRHPHSGSLRFSHDLDIPGLCTCPLAGFPYLLVHIERDDEIDVWRIFHTRRDIPTTLADHAEELRAATRVPPDPARR